MPLPCSACYVLPWHTTECHECHACNRLNAPRHPAPLQVSVREPRPTPGFLLEVASALRCAPVLCAFGAFFAESELT